MAVVERLDLHDPQKIRDFEEAFYRAFLPISNPGIRAIWEWNDTAGRLRTKIPYTDQAIYCARDTEGRIETAVALNVGLREFQSSAYGFEMPASDPRWMEILAVFNLGSERLVTRECSELARLDFTPLDIAWGYGTCSPQVLKVHQRGGWDVLGEREAFGVKRYLLRRDARLPFV